MAVNRLLRAGGSVYWPADRSAGGAAGGTGAMYMPPRPRRVAVLDKAAAELGLDFTGVAARPPARR